MIEAKFTISLAWKSFNIDLNQVDLWMINNAGAYYCGLSGNSQFHVHFDEFPGEGIVESINAYWNDINDSSTEALDYVSKDDRKAATDALKTSARTKLAALGLTEGEIDAIVSIE